MAKRSVSPIGTWVFWSILLLGVFLTVTWEYFIKGFSADTSYISWLILTFFVYGFINSAMVAFYLQGEHKPLKQLVDAGRVAEAGASELSVLLTEAVERIRRGERIDLRNLISAYGTQLSSRVYNLNVISNMLITVGLLGTVLGLLGTVTGLESVLQVSSADFAELKAGMSRTVSGMGTAFYTTFFGALLGGVVLKVLSAEMKKSAAVLVSDALRFSELSIAPESRQASVDALNELEGRICDLNKQMGMLCESFGGVVETIDSKHTVLSAGLEQLVETVAKTSEQATERTQQLVDVITHTQENAAQQASEGLRAVLTALEQQAGKTDERTSELMGALNASLEATNERADERLAAMIRALDDAALGATEKTDARLAGFVEHAEQALERSRKDAELRLSGRANDLAGKLNEAAALLSGVVQPAAADAEIAKQAEEG